MSDIGLSGRMARQMHLNTATGAESTCYDVVRGRATNVWFVFRHGSSEPLASAKSKHRAVNMALTLAVGRAVDVHVEACPPTP